MIASPNLNHSVRSEKIGRTVSLVLHAAGWTFGTLWPIVAISVLAFMLSNPAISQSWLVATVVLVALGSAGAAKVDCWLLSGDKIIQR